MPWATLTDGEVHSVDNRKLVTLAEAQDWLKILNSQIWIGTTIGCGVVGAALASAAILWVGRIAGIVVLALTLLVPFFVVRIAGARDDIGFRQ